MHDLENFALSKLCFESVFYFRYVDDILLCVGSNMSNMIEYTKNIFNMYSEHLQFTVERSRDNKINFLNIEVIVKNDYIITNWYRKPSLIKQLLFDNYYPLDLLNIHIEKRLKFLNNNPKKSKVNNKPHMRRT